MLRIHSPITSQLGWLYSAIQLIADKINKTGRNISYIHTGQDQMENNVKFCGNKDNCHLEATRRDFESQIAWMRPAPTGWNHRTLMVPPSGHCFNASSRPQSITSGHNARRPSRFAGQTADIPHIFPSTATCEDSEWSLWAPQPGRAYRTQLKVRIQLTGKTLLEFAGAVEQLAHRPLVGFTCGLNPKDGRPCIRPASDKAGT